MKNENKIGLSIGLEGVPLGGRTARTVLGVFLLTAAAVYFELSPDELKEWIGLYSAGWMSAWRSHDGDQSQPPPAHPASPQSLATTGGGPGLGEESTAPYASRIARAVSAWGAWARGSVARSWAWRQAYTPASLRAAHRWAF